MAAPHSSENSGFPEHSPDDPRRLVEVAAIAQAKVAMREAVRLRLSQEAHDLAEVSRRLVGQILLGVRLRGGARIGGVWPLAREPDLRPLWAALHARGHPILLPETPPPGHALAFRPWQPGGAMRPGRFATSHPEAPVSADAPDMIFTPLLAFDRDGFRLGHGGGYYDRTLAALPQALAIGYGLACQQVDRVPRGAFDRKLAMIVTEQGAVGPDLNIWTGPRG